MDEDKKKILSRWKSFEHCFEMLAELARQMRIDMQTYWEKDEKKI